ncbi:GPP34 family phosphoprotein [Micromonospora sp. NPDC050980]|uniref:GOLPH3/VPS74 family protein n=1 Tax=Micromonospora sp. NPDC050980 TaxID=3155161 RepID=UPI0033F1FF08
MTSANAPLPLRDELFLLGHDDDTGQPHLYRQALALGLAGAVLIDLFLTGRIVLASGNGRPEGELCLGLHLDRPIGDLVADAAITSLRHARTAPPLRPWLRGFAEDLYERTRAGLHDAGVLRHEVRRRFGGLSRTDCYLLTDTRWAVVARARLRYLAAGRDEPTNHTAALAGLVATLGLTAHLYLGEDTAEVTAQLRAIAGQHHRPVCEITAAVDAAVGDLATATYR